MLDRTDQIQDKVRQVNARRGHRERRSALFAYPPVVIGDTAKPVMIERGFDVHDGPERFQIFLASRTWLRIGPGRE